MAEHDEDRPGATWGDPERLRKAWERRCRHRPPPPRHRAEAFKSRYIGHRVTMVARPLTSTEHAQTTGQVRWWSMTVDEEPWEVLEVTSNSAVLWFVAPQGAYAWPPAASNEMQHGKDGIARFVARGGSLWRPGTTIHRALTYITARCQ